MNQVPIKKGKIRQHYVPQFYLRNFGNQLFCYDKKTGKQINTTPKNIAVKSDFYGGDFHNIPSLEKELSKIENRHSISIQKLIEKKNYYSLEHKDKINICEFLGLQYLRTDQQRNDARSMSNTLVNSIFEPIIPPELKISVSENWLIGLQLESIKDFRKFAVLFFNMKFMIMENNSNIPYWTSDNPISKQNEYDQAPFGNMGITNSGIEIHLPLTPQLCIVAMDPVVYGILPNSTEVDNQGVIRENFLQLRSSKRFVYSQTKRFHLITSMLKDNPHFKDDTRSEHETILGKEDGVTKVALNVERNDRWKIDPTKPIMNEIKTWISFDSVDKIMNDKTLDL